MKYKIMFWLMCFLLYVTLFWFVPLVHNETVDYFAVVIQVHIVIGFIISVSGTFTYLAIKAFG
jgi:hypothetical protein